LEQQPSPRRTTTQLRDGRRRSGRTSLFLLAGLVAALGFSAWVALHTTGADSHGSRPACGANCKPTAVDVRTQSLAAAAPTPCAYCNQDPNRWRGSTDKPPPEIGGKAAAVIEASCGTLVYGVNENAQLPPASLTKIVTAMVALDRAKLSDPVDIHINGWDLAADDGSSIMGVEVGMRLPVEDLLYGMLLVSGNDAAIALTDQLGGEDRFVVLMNDKVHRLGLSNTHFVNPDGRDAPGHYSSALDMALLGRALLQDPALNTIVNTKTYAPHWDGGVLRNANEMIYAYNDAVGVKIGYTEGANYTIVTGIERNGRLLIASVFGSFNLYTDPVRLLNWAFANTKPSCPN
jgi:D-alanyl-D-alanine carboxypeptidase